MAAIAAALSGLDPADEANTDALAGLADAISGTVEAQDQQAEIAGQIADLAVEIDDTRSDQLSALSEAYAPHDVKDLTNESLAELHGLLGLSDESIPDVTAEISDALATDEAPLAGSE
ncbi:hypothetical protein ACFSZS_10780 [Seohaeicola zhoushanensis]